MIDAKALLRDLKRLVTTLEADIRERLAANADLDASLNQEWQAAKNAGRSGATLHDFKAEAVTQAAVHWLLMGVFIRFLEDNGLVDRPWLTCADAARRALAQDRHEAYFRQHPGESDREYLLAAYREVGRLPGMAALFDERHNPLFRLDISGDGAMAILGFWQKIDPDTGKLVHDFTDADWSTRFLGDLYQDLSEAAQKKFALLQTPEFVEEFILDRTLDPAIAEFGYKEVRLIDPTCGSGHFLLGGFKRLLDHWQRNEPGRNVRDSVQQALNGIHGVNLNPFAVAISRFRLLVAALKASGETRLAEAPNFSFHLAAGDSLLHGPELGRQQDRSLFSQAETYRGTALEHAFASEDLADLNRILGQAYHAVVGNPPYIAARDSALNVAYRQRYKTCHGKYSLGVPFTERLFELACNSDKASQAGFVGMITTNSFMKREFGKQLVEAYLPMIDLTHIIDTKDAYIPGHGTPTVILFGRNRNPVQSVIRTVMGIKGETETPLDPRNGLVWQSIVSNLDSPGVTTEYSSVSDSNRSKFSIHPWSIGGGGASELKATIDSRMDKSLGDLVDIGIAVVTLEDDAYQIPAYMASGREFSSECVVEFISGDLVRDWTVASDSFALFPHESKTFVPQIDQPVFRWLWPLRTTLANRLWFKKTQLERGYPWYAYGHISTEKFSSKYSIAFAFVASHNHFILDRSGKVFNRSSPVIKVKGATSDLDYFATLGLLNSSLACFWMKQVFYPKATATGDISIEKGKPEANRYEFTSSGLANFPIPREIGLVLKLAKLIDALAISLQSVSPESVTANWIETGDAESFEHFLGNSRIVYKRLFGRMIALQEELDWECYRVYGLTDFGASEDIVSDENFTLSPEERPYQWPKSSAPESLNTRYISCFESRKRTICDSAEIALIESSVTKRPWLGRQGVYGLASKTFEERAILALRGWLLNWIEKYLGGKTAMLITTTKLADCCMADKCFSRVAAAFVGRVDFDFSSLVGELVLRESIPLLPVLRYSISGLRKRAEWERTWALQRLEDAIDAATTDETERKRRKAAEVGDIPVPPKYKSADFQKADFWRLRGGLDMPKERFVSFPHCSRAADGSLAIAWAGLNPLQLATAIAAHYVDLKDNEGWEAERLKPLLGGIAELVPWIKQWHNDPDAEHGTRMGDYLDGFVDEEARGLGLTREAIVGWQPPASAVRRGRRRAT